MKLLSDKRELHSLSGKISIGILIIQDLVAVIVLMLISSLSGGASLSTVVLKAFVGGGGLIVILFLLGIYVLPKFIRKLAYTQEILFLFSICWCFVIAVLFSLVGFSFEIGALIAGVVLSISPYSTEISSKIRPLRDFFLILFFIILGIKLDLTNLSGIIVPAIVFALVALILKPLIIMTFSAMFGFTRRINFRVGTTLAQISEFSLIVLALGVSIGHISDRILSIIVLGAVLTIAISTYWITHGETLYQKIGGGFRIFERKKPKRQRKPKKDFDAILFGYNRIGFSILQSLKRIKKRYLVVDFNPEIVSDLTKLRIPCIYGDADDADFVENLPLKSVKLAISTIPDVETNKLLIDTIKIANPKAMVIVRASTVEDALALYDHGATYVLTPHLLGGEYVAKMIHEEKLDEKAYAKEKKKHLELLKKRMKMDPSD